MAHQRRQEETVNQIAPAAANAAQPQPPFEDIGAGWDLPRQSSGPISTLYIMRWSAAISTSHRVRYHQPFARAVAGRPEAPAAGSRFAATIVGHKLSGNPPHARLAQTGTQAVAA